MPRPNIVERAKILDRRAKACKLRVQGYTYAQIAEQLGYSSEKVAQVDVSRALKSYVEYQAQSVEELRAAELAKLEAAERVVNKVLKRKHVLVNNGRVVYTDDEDGHGINPIIDDGPTLAAVDRVVKISESRRKLLPGVDAPSKVEGTVGGTVEYVVKVAQEELDQV